MTGTGLGTATDEAFRLGVWRAHGANDAQARELLAYAASPLQERLPDARRYPLPDAPHVADWARYAAEADSRGAAAVLRRVLVQLRFPIRTGMSQDPAYLAATRRGQLPETPPPAMPDALRDALRDATGAAPFADPDGLRIFLTPTPAGRVPVVLAESRADFERLVQAVTHRNEPVPLPPSMGASMVAGYNNWDRVGHQRRAFEAAHPDDADGQAWEAAFRELIPRKELYQDRFMLLSAGPYSSTPASDMGLPDADWRAMSIRLRMAHECSHYVTRQVFGFMRQSLLDEIVADYFGLLEATGTFPAAAFLRFLGLESYPAYRDGGRLENYRGAPPLSHEAFVLVRPVVKRAAEQLERLDPSRHLRPFDMAAKARVTIALLRVGLEGLASDEAPERLAMALAEAGPLAAARQEADVA